MSAFRYVFVRHARSEANAHDLLCGRRSSPLSPEGLKQAKSLAKRLQDEGFNRVICSTAARAQRTIRALNSPPQVELLPELQERDFGEWEGLKRADLKSRPDWNAHMLSWTGRPPGGQSPRTQALGALKTLSQREQTDTLLVSHAGLIRSLLGLLDRAAPRDFLKRRVPHCTPISRTLTPNAWQKTYTYALNIGEEDGSTLPQSDRL